MGKKRTVILPQHIWGDQYKSPAVMSVLHPLMIEHTRVGIHDRQADPAGPVITIWIQSDMWDTKLDQHVPGQKAQPLNAWQIIYMSKMNQLVDAPILNLLLQVRDQIAAFAILDVQKPNPRVLEFPDSSTTCILGSQHYWIVTAHHAAADRRALDPHLPRRSLARTNLHHRDCTAPQIGRQSQPE